MRSQIIDSRLFPAHTTSIIYFTRTEELVGALEISAIPCVHVCQAYYIRNILLDGSDSPEQYEHCKGTNNTPVNTCYLHIIITEKSTPLIF